MSFFAWEKKYEIGIESIDNDHQKLVGLIDELYIAMTKGRAKEILNDIVSGLIDYTKIHFKREEMYMKTVGYNDLDNHKATHDAFIERVMEFQKELELGNTNISIDVITFLRDWLLVHILNVDRRFASEFSRFGIK